jgi:hypothetical protein
LSAGFALFFRRTQAAGLAIVTTLAAGFSTVIASAMVRRLDIACGCFGHDTGALWLSLVRALILTGLSLWLFYSSTPRTR